MLFARGFEVWQLHQVRSLYCLLSWKTLFLTALGCPLSPVNQLLSWLL